MTTPDLSAYLHGFNNAIELMQRISFLVLAAYLATRWTWLRELLQTDNKLWRQRLGASLFFGTLAIIGTHSGIVLDIEHGYIMNWRPQPASGLLPSQAIISFRDLTVMVAGLTCGAWGGFGAGLLAGGERFFLGGYVALGAALATVLLGWGAGLARSYRPHAVKYFPGVLIIILTGTIVQKIVILLLSENYSDTVLLIKNTFVTSIITNLLGSLLFLYVMQELERERLKITAELRALQAQVEPHFLSNALNSIKALIRVNPSKAAESVVYLARFFHTTRPYAAANAITLKQELEHLRLYVELQKLCLPQSIRLDFKEFIAADLLDSYLLPRCIETLVENCFTHALRGQSDIFELSVGASKTGNFMIISVSDNGCGIPPDRLVLLGIQSVNSATGSGTALQHLKQSLELAYHGAARLNITSQIGAGTTVELTLPHRSISW